MRRWSSQTHDARLGGALSSVVPNMECCPGAASLSRSTWKNCMGLCYALFVLDRQGISAIVSSIRNVCGDKGFLILGGWLDLITLTGSAKQASSNLSRTKAKLW